MSETAEVPVSSMALETGQAIAWVTRYKGATHALSSVHRVYDRTKTYCLREIPEADRLFPPLKSLHVCSRCATMCKRAESVLLQEKSA